MWWPLSRQGGGRSVLSEGRGIRRMPAGGCCWREGNRKIGRISFDMVICLCKHSRRAVHYVEGGVFKEAGSAAQGRLRLFFLQKGFWCLRDVIFPMAKRLYEQGGRLWTTG